MKYDIVPFRADRQSVETAAAAPRRAAADTADWCHAHHDRAPRRAVAANAGKQREGKSCDRQSRCQGFSMLIRLPSDHLTDHILAYDWISATLTCDQNHRFLLYLYTASIALHSVSKSVSLCPKSDAESVLIQKVRELLPVVYSIHPRTSSVLIRF